MPMSFLRFSRNIVATVTLLLAASSVWAGYNIWTNEYTVSKAELQDTLSQQLPKKVDYRGMFQVTVSNPVLSLDAAKNRLTTLVDARIASPLFLKKDINAKVALNSGVKYNAAKRALQLDQPAISQVKIDGNNEQANQEVTSILSEVFAELLKDYPLYTFTEEQLTLKGVRFEPGKITVGEDEVKVEVIQK
jgi:hypothetical protein